MSYLDCPRCKNAEMIKMDLEPDADETEWLFWKCSKCGLSYSSYLEKWFDMNEYTDTA